MEKHGEIVYGVNAVLEAVRAGGRERIKRIVIADSRKYTEQVKELISLAGRKNIPVERKSSHCIDKMCGTVKNQGIVGFCCKKKNLRLDDLVAMLPPHSIQYPTLAIVEGVEDPQNLGALIRSAEVFGINGIVIPKRRAVGITSTVSKSSAGAVEYIPIVTVTNIVRAIEWLKAKGFWVVAAEADAEKKCCDVDFLVPMVIVLGGESKGIREIVKRKCDFSVSIPMKGVVSSLNVSAAGAVIFYEVLRQKNKMMLKRS